MIKLDLKKETQAAMDFTKYVTTQWNSRLVGSKACLACGDYIYNHLSTFCEKTDKEAFDLHPGAFLGYFRIICVLYFLSLVALVFQAYFLAVIPITISVVIFIFQFFFYKEFLDPLYPQKKGQNVYGSIEPKGEVKQQIIFSAHHDSAHIFNHYQENPEKYGPKILAGAITIFSMFVLSWMFWVVDTFSSLSPTFYWGAFAFLAISGLSLYFFWTFYDRENGTPGAGDNMACLAVAIEVGKYFSKLNSSGEGLQHTRIVIGSWDGEEAGLRGARAFVKKHKAELTQLKTYNFNLECMYDNESLHFLTSDLNGFVPLSTSMVEDGLAVSKQLGYSTSAQAFPLLAGGTDAAEFAKIGVEATTLVAMKWENKDAKSMNYHTTRDTIDAVDPMAVHNSIAIGIHYALEKDKTD
ncbi:MAG: M28 family peptidase [Chitinophagales bacterium]